jgi:hypothetical protein
MVASYAVSGGIFTAGKPRPWAEKAIVAPGQHVDLAPDGKRFIVLAPPDKADEKDEKADLHITFLLNLFDELKRKLPAGGR